MTGRNGDAARLWEQAYGRGLSPPEKSLVRLSDRVILRRQPKNLEGVSHGSMETLRGVYPELAEGLRMTKAGKREAVGQSLEED